MAADIVEKRWQWAEQYKLNMDDNTQLSCGERISLAFLLYGVDN